MLVYTHEQKARFAFCLSMINSDTVAVVIGQDFQQDFFAKGFTKNWVRVFFASFPVSVNPPKCFVILYFTTRLIKRKRWLHIISSDRQRGGLFEETN